MLNTRSEAGAVTVKSRKIRAATGGFGLQRALETLNRIWCSLDVWIRGGEGGVG